MAPGAASGSSLPSTGILPVLGIGIQRVPSFWTVTGGDVGLAGAGSGRPAPAGGVRRPALRRPAPKGDPRSSGEGQVTLCPGVASGDPRPAGWRQETRARGWALRELRPWGPATRAQQGAQRELRAWGRTTSFRGRRIAPSFLSGPELPGRYRAYRVLRFRREGNTPPVSPATEPASGRLAEAWSDGEADPDAEVGSATAPGGVRGTSFGSPGGLSFADSAGTR